MQKNKTILIPFVLISLLVLASVYLISKQKSERPSVSPVKEDVRVKDVSTQDTDFLLKQKMASQISKKYNKPLENVLIEILNRTEAYAKGSVSFTDEQGGGMWFAAKTNNGWELAFDGNGIITCDVVTKYNFPAEIIPGCIDTENGNELIQRN